MDREQHGARVAWIAPRGEHRCMKLFIILLALCCASCTGSTTDAGFDASTAE